MYIVRNTMCFMRVVSSLQLINGSQRNSALKSGIRSMNSWLFSMSLQIRLSKFYEYGNKLFGIASHNC